MNDIRKIIKEAINKKFYDMNKTFNETLRCEAVFQSQLTEDTNDRKQDVLTKIENDDYENQNPQRFYIALNKSKHKKMLTDYSVSDLSKMKLFKVSGYDIGFALKKWEDGKYSEIVAVFNNEPDIEGIGKPLMKSAIKNGGCYLDHFDGFLSGLYQPLGFVEYKRDPYNSAYDPEGTFKNQYGEADVIYRVHKNCA